MKITKKNIIIAGTILIIILIMVQIFYAQRQNTPVSDNIGNSGLLNNNITPTNFSVAVTPNYPSITPIPLETETKTGFVVNWNKVQSVNPKNTYPIYFYQSLFGNSNINKIANSLGFLDSQKQDLLGNSIWKTDDSQKIFLYTPKEKALSYQLITEVTVKTPLNEDEIKQTVINTLTAMFPSGTFRVKSVTYLLKSLFATLITPDKAEIVKVDVDQLINGFPVIPQTLVSSSFATFILNRDLSYSSFTINDGVSNLQESSVKQTYDINTLKKAPADSFINITTLRVDQEQIINQSTQVIYQVEKIEPAYIPINNTVSPVYLISGKITPNNRPTIPYTVQYIVPMR